MSCEVAALEAKIFSIPWSEAGFLSSLQSKDTLYLAVRKSGQLIGYAGFYSLLMKQISRMLRWRRHTAGAGLLHGCLSG